MGDSCLDREFLSEIWRILAVPCEFRTDRPSLKSLWLFVFRLVRWAASFGECRAMRLEIRVVWAGDLMWGKVETLVDLKQVGDLLSYFWGLACERFRQDFTLTIDFMSAYSLSTAFSQSIFFFDPDCFSLSFLREYYGDEAVEWCFGGWNCYESIFCDLYSGRSCFK